MEPDTFEEADIPGVIVDSFGELDTIAGEDSDSRRAGVEQPVLEDWSKDMDYHPAMAVYLIECCLAGDSVALCRPSQLD